MKRRVYKILLALTVMLSIVFNATLTTSAASPSCWYIKRNGKLCPGFPADAESLTDYGCYYIDKRYGDDSCDKKIYITFDAGYENGNVERIVNALNEENVPAAFFVLDNIILKNTDLVKKMAESGHLVCNHTKRHKDLSLASSAEISEDLSALERIYTDKTGYTMAPYFRFPEGKYSPEAVRIVNELGYKTVFWSFAYADWDNSHQPRPEQALKKILDNTHNGAVMLFHPTSETNAEIFPTLIKEWKALGYSFGTLDELTS